MTPLQVEIGDVSRNDTLSTLDASLILQYTVGLIEGLPINTGTQYYGGGNLTMSNQGINPGMTIEVPIAIDNGINIFGFKGFINYDPNILTFDTLIIANHFSNYLAESNLISQGTIMVAAAGGAVDVNSGNLATLVFKVSDDFNNDTEISLTNWEWNDGQLLNTPVSMILSYGLDIKNNLIFLLIQSEKFNKERWKQPCYDWLTLNGKLAVENLLRFENLNDDFQKMCSQLNLPTTIKNPHLNKKNREIYFLKYP